jgi:hypothetical protein
LQHEPFTDNPGFFQFAPDTQKHIQHIKRTFAAVL